MPKIGENTVLEEKPFTILISTKHWPDQTKFHQKNLRIVLARERFRSCWHCWSCPKDSAGSSLRSPSRWRCRRLRCCQTVPEYLSQDRPAVSVILWCSRALWLQKYFRKRIFYHQYGYLDQTLTSTTWNETCDQIRQKFGNFYAILCIKCFMHFDWLICMLNDRNA